MRVDKQLWQVVDTDVCVGEAGGTATQLTAGSTRTPNKLCVRSGWAPSAPDTAHPPAHPRARMGFLGSRSPLSHVLKPRVCVAPAGCRTV